MLSNGCSCDLALEKSAALEEVRDSGFVFLARFRQRFGWGRGWPLLGLPASGMAHDVARVVEVLDQATGLPAGVPVGQACGQVFPLNGPIIVIEACEDFPVRFEDRAFLGCENGRRFPCGAE